MCLGDASRRRTRGLSDVLPSVGRHEERRIGDHTGGGAPARGGARECRSRAGQWVGGSGARQREGDALLEGGSLCPGRTPAGRLGRPVPDVPKRRGRRTTRPTGAPSRGTVGGRTHPCRAARPPRRADHDDAPGLHGRRVRAPRPRNSRPHVATSTSTRVEPTHVHPRSSGNLVRAGSRTSARDPARTPALGLAGPDAAAAPAVAWRPPPPDGVSQALSTSRSRWLMTAETPSPRIVTPYSASPTSIVRFWWVMTSSWEFSRSSS